MKRRHWILSLILTVVVLMAVSFGLAAILSEGAVHRLITRRATDTAALAHSIATSVNATETPVVLRSRDGVSLHAWWLVPQHFDGKAVMLCHGVADSAYGTLGYALMFLQQGYAVLAPDSRGHGESKGFVTYGVLEADDTLEWLRWMQQHGVHESYGFGESLGGSILLESLDRGARFRAIVAECPYASFRRVAVSRVAQQIARVPFASELANLEVEEGIVYLRWRYGVNLEQAQSIQAVKRTRTPILLIHGLRDNETPPDNSIAMARANPQTVKLWLVPNATHTGAYAAAPQEFRDRVLGWFANH